MTHYIEKLIENFGGLSAMAQLLGHKNPTTVQGWKQKKRIPEWRVKEILSVANKNNINIPNEFNQSGEMKVLISDDLSPLAIETFNKLGVKVDIKVGLKRDELLKIIGNYDGLAIRSATKVDAGLLEKATRLKVIGRAGIGVDNVDVNQATKKGIIVMNTPFGNSITTAEHTIAMILSVARLIPQANASTHTGKWEKKRFVGTEVTSKILGLIGVGNIGSIVANRALGLKMKVVAYDPFLSDERAKKIGVQRIEKLDELLKISDFISVHTPLTDSTKNILNADSFAKCKDGVRVINCARGGIINEADLLDALNSGKVAGAGLDVFEVEPATKNILFGHEKVIMTPHLGASTSEAQENVALQVAEQMGDYLVNGGISNALNMPSISAEDAKKVYPYMELGTQLGKFAGQILGGSNIKGISIEMGGAVANLDSKPISQTILSGLFGVFYDTFNVVNARLIAKELNIDVAVTQYQSDCDYNTVIYLKILLSNGKEISVGGSLFGSNNPRLISINGVRVESEFCPHMLYVVNQDIPGHIGRIGSFLGEKGMNIGSFALGRLADKAQAISIIELEQSLANDIMKDVSDLETVVETRLIAM